MDHARCTNYGMVNCPIDSVAAPQIYSYDDAGNRADPGDTLGVGDQMNAVTFSGMHQDYTYDADGNVITRALPADNATWTYTWSSDNRLLSGSNWIGMENLAYDALGQPVVIRKGSDNHIARVTLYDGGNVLADLDSLGNREGEYVYDAGTDHPYALLTGATAVTGVQYFVLDDFGNVTGTVYDSTHVAQTISYDDWGDATVTGDTTNRLAWKGLPIDSHLWLSEVRARWYDPVLGRFISEDPLGLSAGINPYVFANNDPVNGSDPSGLSECITIDVPPVDVCDGPLFCTHSDGYSNTVCISGGGGGSGGSDWGAVPLPPPADMGGGGGSGSKPKSKPVLTAHDVACATAVGEAALNVAVDLAGASEIRAATQFGALALRVGAEYTVRSFSVDFARSFGEGVSKASFNRLAPAFADAVNGYSTAAVAHAASAYSSVGGTVIGQFTSGNYSLWDYVPVVSSIRSIVSAYHTCH